MNHDRPPLSPVPELQYAAEAAIAGRCLPRPLQPLATAEQLRVGFAIPLREESRCAIDVLRELTQAATPGLVGSTNAGFMAWVIGGSHPAGVAADWLATAWGQNAAMFQAAPSAALAEEVAGNWLLDLLDLPDASSVGFTTGATMAAFACLAAARLAVLSRAGYDLEEHGLTGAPDIRVLIADDAHVTNFAALRYLGFGRAQVTKVPSTREGLFEPDALTQALAARQGLPTIVIAQAGHIMSGGFDDLERVAQLCRAQGAWLHADGAFGLWARASARYRHLAKGAELADSWSVDGHKWLQLPYDSGFAIVREREWHRAAMRMSAGYLQGADNGTHDPADYVPELSRRARGFAAWAVMQVLGRAGIAAMVDRHCDAARLLADRLEPVAGIVLRNEVVLNQLAIGFIDPATGQPCGRLAREMSDRLNATGLWFLRTSEWNGETVLRVSIISGDAGNDMIVRLADDLIAEWSALRTEWA